MALPKISIVTPSYNQGKFLEETIQSILGQGYANLEYILIDGGSSDQSVEIIKRYQNQLAYWVSEKDGGFGDAINKGLAKATGEILAWVNSDDLLLPGALNTIGSFFENYSNVGLVFGDRHIIDERSVLTSRRQYYFYFPGQLRYAKTFPQECTFWRKDVFLKVGPLDERLKFAIDFDLWCRISAISKIRHIPFYLGAFRAQRQSKSATIAGIGIDERDRIVIKYFGHLKSKFAHALFQIFWGLARRSYSIVGLTRLKRSSISRRIRKVNNLGTM